jgi:hypothetical protein
VRNADATPFRRERPVPKALLQSVAIERRILRWSQPVRHGVFLDQGFQKVEDYLYVPKIPFGIPQAALAQEQRR